VTATADLLHRTGRPTAADAAPSTRGLTPTLILVGLVLAALSSLGAPLIPDIAAASHVTLSTGAWLLTITLLTGALSTPILGRLADGPRQRRVIVAALVPTLVGCVLAALTSSFALLVVARGLQGLGLGLLPVTMAIARRHLPPAESASTLAMLSVTAAIGVGLGYPITGLLAEASDYHLAFWFGAAVVAAALVFSLLVIPPRSEAPKRSFDTVGATLLTGAVALFILVLSEGESWGWGSGRVIGMFVLSLLLLAVWARYELQRTDPLIDLRQARNRMVLTADISGLIISLTMYLFLPIVVEFVQVPRTVGFGFGASVVVAGCVLIPLSVGTFVASRVAPAYERRFGRRTMIPIGSMLFAAAMALFAFEHASLWEAFLVMAIAGVGIGFTFAAMPGFIIQAVAPHETGSAMGFYQVLRSVGLAIGSAVSGVALAMYTKPHSAFPEVGGFEVALIIGAILCLAVAVGSYVLPGRGRSRGDDPLAMEETAELGGAGVMLTDGRATSPSAS
jgi:MFS family permease